MAEFTEVPPPSLMQPVERRKSRSGGRTLAAIGTLIILSDGTKCVVAGYAQNGDVLCYPEE